MAANIENITFKIKNCFILAIIWSIVDQSSCSFIYRSRTTWTTFWSSIKFISEMVSYIKNKTLIYFICVNFKNIIPAIFVGRFYQNLPKFIWGMLDNSGFSLNVLSHSVARQLTIIQNYFQMAAMFYTLIIGNPCYWLFCSHWARE